MKIIDIIEEDFVNYKKPCMVIEFPYCSFKCDKECGTPVCQNGALATAEIIDIDVNKIVVRYLQNKITSAVVLQGLEPLDSWKDIISFVNKLRYYSDDDIVIYTGYKKEEIQNVITFLKQYKNIVIKYGRYIPGQDCHKDPVLEVNLASDNQYAEKIS